MAADAHANADGRAFFHVTRSRSPTFTLRAAVGGASVLGCATADLRCAATGLGAAAFGCDGCRDGCGGGGRADARGGACCLTALAAAGPCAPPRFLPASLSLSNVDTALPYAASLSLDRSSNLADATARAVPEVCAVGCWCAASSPPL